MPGIVTVSLVCTTIGLKKRSCNVFQVTLVLGKMLPYDLAAERVGLASGVNLLRPFLSLSNS